MNDYRPIILIIDDTPENLKTLGAVLSTEFRLRIATSGTHGLSLAEQSPPDLILLDVMMPEMDGYDTYRQIKANPKLQLIPVIFVTVLTEHDAENSGLKLGAADYITKPIDVEIARQRIRNLLEREHLRKEVEAYRDFLEEMVKTCTKAISVIQDAIIMVNHDENISFWNNAAEHIFGYISSEAVGRKIHDFILLPGAPIKKVFQELEEYGKIKSINEITEVTLLRKDRKKITIELSLSAVSLNNKWTVIIVARDITEHKNTEYYIAQIRQVLHNKINSSTHHYAHS